MSNSSHAVTCSVVLARISFSFSVSGLLVPCAGECLTSMLTDLLTELLTKQSTGTIASITTGILVEKSVSSQTTSVQPSSVRPSGTSVVSNVVLNVPNAATHNHLDVPCSHAGESGYSRRNIGSKIPLRTGLYCSSAVGTRMSGDLGWPTTHMIASTRSMLAVFRKTILNVDVRDLLNPTAAARTLL